MFDYKGGLRVVVYVLYVGLWLVFVCCVCAGPYIVFVCCNVDIIGLILSYIIDRHSVAGFVFSRKRKWKTTSKIRKLSRIVLMVARQSLSNKMKKIYVLEN